MLRNLTIFGMDGQEKFKAVYGKNGEIKEKK